MHILQLLFLPEVWGTVADWAMVSITAITAYYLYQTLKSQHELQKLQYESVELENRKFSDTIKPVFEYDILTRNVKNIENGLTTTAVVVRGINVSDFKASKVSAGFRDTKNLIDYHGSHESPHIHPGKHMALAFTMKADHSNILDDNNVVKILVTYTDSFRNTYVQEIYYTDAIALFDVSAGLMARDPEILQNH